MCSHHKTGSFVLVAVKCALPALEAFAGFEQGCSMSDRCMAPPKGVEGKETGPSSRRLNKGARRVLGSEQRCAERAAGVTTRGPFWWCGGGGAGRQQGAADQWGGGWDQQHTTLRRLHEVGGGESRVPGHAVTSRAWAARSPPVQELLWWPLWSGRFVLPCFCFLFNSFQLWQ